MFLLACAPSVEPGTTLVGLSYPSHAQKIIEIDQDGSLLWMYRLPEDWTRSGDLAAFELTPAGTLLLSIEGAGVYEVDRTGTLLWQHADPLAGFDVDRLPSGNTAIARTFAPRGEPQIVEVAPTGEAVWSWTGEDALGSDQRVSEVTDEHGGWLHVTGVERTDTGTRVASRNLNGIVQLGPDDALVDEWTLDSPPNTRLAVTKGPVVGERPHGVEWLGERHLLVATRRPHAAVELLDGKVVWRHEDPELTHIRDLDRLEGGHTLVTGHDQLLEVDDSGRVVWAWTAPDALALVETRAPLVGAIRVRPDGTTADRD